MDTYKKYLNEGMNQKTDLGSIIKQLQTLQDDMKSFNVGNKDKVLNKMGSQGNNLKNLAGAISLLKNVKV